MSERHEQLQVLGVREMVGPRLSVCSWKSVGTSLDVVQISFPALSFSQVVFCTSIYTWWIFQYPSQKWVMTCAKVMWNIHPSMKQVLLVVPDCRTLLVLSPLIIFPWLLTSVNLFCGTSRFSSLVPMQVYMWQYPWWRYVFCALHCPLVCLAYWWRQVILWCKQI